MKKRKRGKHQLRLSGERRTGTVKEEGRQTTETLVENDDLTKNLMEEVCKARNLNQAYRRVKANKGAAGVEGMTVEELFTWISEHKESLIQSLLGGTYKPKPVRGVEIPKPGGNGIRELGIPCVVDRLVQQGILQILDPIFEPTFSESSFGFRPKRSAHQALKKAQGYVKEG